MPRSPNVGGADALDLSQCFVKCCKGRLFDPDIKEVAAAQQMRDHLSTVHTREELRVYGLNPFLLVQDSCLFKHNDGELLQCCDLVGEISEPALRLVTQNM